MVALEVHTICATSQPSGKLDVAALATGPQLSRPATVTLLIYVWPTILNIKSVHGDTVADDIGAEGGWTLRS